ncbi:MAG: peptidylprolyl isomerase [Planctomycetota bacterium]|jgi:parvulin-like peptidyl-prolyl isomerase
MRFKDLLIFGLLSGVFLFCSVYSPAAYGVESAASVSTSQPTISSETGATSAPATSSAPALVAWSKIVLVRLGDKEEITQADFALMVSAVPLEKYERLKDPKFRELISKRQMKLYGEEHPDLVSETEVDEAVKKFMKDAKLKTPKELEDRLAKFGTSLKRFRLRKRLRIAHSKLVKEGVDRGKDVDKLRKMFEDNPWEFDGTRVEARHIMMRLEPYYTPAERAEKRNKLAKIREDLDSGKRTWDQCVEESESGTKLRGGKMGSFPRHRRLSYGEPVAKAAFALKPGELSEIVEGPYGFHIIEATGRKPGYKTFEQVKSQIKIRLQEEVFEEAVKEINSKYPIVGVRAPMKPGFLKSMKDSKFRLPRRPASRPSARPKARSTRRSARPPATRTTSR